MRLQYKKRVVLEFECSKKENGEKKKKERDGCNESKYDEREER